MAGKKGLYLLCSLLISVPMTAQETNPVWLDMNQAELDAAYDQAVYAPNLEQVLARQAANSRLAREALGQPLRFRYGEQQDEGLDVYPSGEEDSPILIYIHGGTWRFGVAADNAFAAQHLVNAGFNYVVPDFSSVQVFAGDLEGLVGQLQRAVAWVYEHADEFGGDTQRIYLAGFSSGAHLAGVLLTTDWLAMGLPPDPFKGALLCSGMYDMTPVALSFRREFVKLNEDNIPRLSPQSNLKSINTPLLVAYGTRETPEFQRQARDFVEALQSVGKPADLVVGEEYNHFEIIETLGNPYGILGNAVRDLLAGRVP